tara:strand:+ start:161 stop:772 length:612 start_codon:yes stop_codon:yes gene_type:complete
MKYKHIKRFFDLSISFFLLFTLSPLIIFISILILFSDGKPIFFRQVRVGEFGKNFNIIKFRSMKISNEDIFTGNIHKGETEEEARKRFKTTEKDDKRITKVGKFIRSTHIDELPQLFNVIRGEMSLIGPRPDVQAQKCEYTSDDWQKRISVKPGISGLAQISPPDSSKSRTYFDIKYINNISFKVDLFIFFGTIYKLFRYRSF